MAQGRRRERIVRQPWQKATPEAYAQQRAFRRLQAACSRLSGWWAQRKLRWDDVKWGLISIADEVRADIGVEVRMEMLAAVEAPRLGFADGYAVHIQVGDPPTAMTIVSHFAAGGEAPAPAGGDKDTAKSYYHCEPGDVQA